MEHSTQLSSSPLCSHPPGKPQQRQLRTDRQTDSSARHIPGCRALQHVPGHPKFAGKHGQGPGGVRSLAPPCPRRQQPWERKARTKMTFLLIQAIKNKVERGRSQLPTLPSSKAPNPLVLLVNHQAELVRAQPVSARQPAPGTAGTFPTFNISFWLSSSPRGCIPAGRNLQGPVLAALGITIQLQRCKNWDYRNSQTAMLSWAWKTKISNTGVCANIGLALSV